MEITFKQAASPARPSTSIYVDFSSLQYLACSCMYSGWQKSIGSTKKLALLPKYVRILSRNVAECIIHLAAIKLAEIRYQQCTEADKHIYINWQQNSWQIEPMAASA